MSRQKTKYYQTTDTLITVLTIFQIPYVDHNINLTQQHAFPVTRRRALSLSDTPGQFQNRYDPPRRARISGLLRCAYPSGMSDLQQPLSAF